MSMENPADTDVLASQELDRKRQELLDAAALDDIDWS